MRRLAFVVALLLIVIPGEFAPAVASPTGPVLLVRKDVKDLTPAEKAEFVNAVLKLKQTPSPYDPSLSYYDQFVWWHRQAFLCNIDAAHMWASFLPWHRELLLLFERGLQQVSGDPNLTIPYWDWTDPNSTAAVFAPDFMGGMGVAKHHYAVMNGPFRAGQWRLNIVDQKVNDQYGRRYLVRRFGTKLGATLPTTEEVATALGKPVYDVPPYDATVRPWRSFRQYIEGWRSVIRMKCDQGLMTVVSRPNASHDMHNRVHLWVGGVWGFGNPRGPQQGTMALNTSLNDPVFWLHHANIDRIWSQWERMHGKQYEPVSGAKKGQNIGDTMWPYNTVGIDTRIRDLLDITKLGYTYAAP
jgi:tyrosinase